MRLRLLSSVWGASLCSLALLSLALGVSSLGSLLTASTVYAQADKLSDDKLLEEAAPAKAAAGADAGQTGGAPTSRSKSWLRWLYESLGPMYSVIFLFLSFSLVSVIVMNLLGLRRDNVVPPAVAQAFEACLEEKKYQEAYELARADDSLLGRVLAAGMGKISAGYEEAAKAMEEAGQEETMRLEHRLGYVALIAQIGPMFGLLGTVDGMVQAFDVIAASNTTPKPNQLAQGIGTALVTTVVGLWIAIPSIAFNHVVRARLARLLLEAGTITENLMGRFAVKKG
jgi:biopolymer transport protein ExbB